jgi:hypothetical protein
MTEFSERQLDLVAQAFRNSVISKPHESTDGWKNCRAGWIDDLKTFVVKLDKLGFEIAPIKKSPVDPKGAQRFG